METKTEAPPGGWPRIGAWATFLLTIALLVLAFVVNHSATGVSWNGQQTDLTVINPLISVFVGAVIIDRRGSNIVGWLFCMSGFFWGIQSFATAYAASIPNEGTLPFELAVLWTSSWTGFLAFGLAPVLAMFVFPSGRLPGSRWKWIFRAAIAALALGVLGSALAPGPMEDIRVVDNPIGVGGALGEIASLFRELSWPLILLSAGFGVRSLRVRAVRGTSVERQQVKWMMLGGVVVVISVLGWGTMDILKIPVPSFFSALFLPWIPVAVGVAILRYRLYDIDVLINRTLVYASLSAVLVAFYLGAVFLLQELLAPVTPESDLAIAASTLAVAGMFGPLRTRIQAFIDRRFYRSKYDAAATLETFSARVRNEVDLEALSQDVVDVVSGTVQPTHASLWLRDREPVEN